MWALGLLAAATSLSAPRVVRERVCTYTAPSGDHYDISGLSQPGTEWTIVANSTEPGDAWTFYWNGCDGTLSHPSDGRYPDEPGCLGPESDDQDAACQHGPRELDPHAHTYGLGKLTQVRFAEERPGFLAVDYQRSGFEGRSLTVEITCDRDAADPIFELNLSPGGGAANSVLRVRSVHGCVVDSPPTPPPPPPPPAPAPGAKCFRLGPTGLPRNLRLNAQLSVTRANEEPGQGPTTLAGQWMSSFGYEGATGQWFARATGIAAVVSEGGTGIPPLADFPRTMYVAGEVNRTFEMTGNVTDAEGRPVISHCHSLEGDLSMDGKFVDVYVGNSAFNYLFDGADRSTCVGEGTDFEMVANRTIAAQSFSVYAAMDPPSSAAGAAAMQVPAEYVLFEEQMGEDGPENIPVSYSQSGTVERADVDGLEATQIQFSDWAPHENIPPEEWLIPAACYEGSGWNEKVRRRPAWHGTGWTGRG
jgi:hypothetical protein